MSESEHEVTLNGYIRLCAKIFCAVLCTTGAMIWASFLPHYSWTFKVALIIAIAVVNAFLVAGYLMHLLSEKKLVYTVLICTVGFFISLMGLTLWALNDFPMGTVVK
jgi:hypothetical protein